MTEEKKEEKSILEHTITIRASREFKDKLEGLAKDCTSKVDGEVKVTDLVRLGLDWVLLHNADQVVALLVGEDTLDKHQ